MSISEGFGVDAGRNPEEVQFIDAFLVAIDSEPWEADGWIFDECLTISVDVSDNERKVVLRTLRADFYGNRVLLGKDETGQLISVLDKSSPDVLHAENQPPAALAGVVAKWFAAEVSRPIERREWNRIFFKHVEWILADTNRTIVWRDSKNRKRVNLGKPDRITRI